jgi:hypothetical protein
MKTALIIGGNSGIKATIILNEHREVTKYKVKH